MKSGRIFNRKSNSKVFTETLLRYVKDYSEGDHKKPLDADGFKTDIDKLFPDATEKMRQSVMSYFGGLISMSKEDYIQTVKISSGASLNRSMAVFYWLTFLPSILIPVWFLYYGRFLALPWLLGVVAGLLLAYRLYSADRFQVWFMIAFSIVLAIIGTGISAKAIGNLDLNEKRFPLAKVFMIDKKAESGFILGKFSDRYVMMPYGIPDTGKRINIQSSQVISMNLICLNRDANSLKENEDKAQNFLKDMGNK